MQVNQQIMTNLKKQLKKRLVARLFDHTLSDFS